MFSLVVSDTGVGSTASRVRVGTWMDANAKRWVRLLIGLAAMLALVAVVLLTPVGGWLSAGATGLWRGFLSLPGIAWARENMGAAPAEDGQLAPEAASEDVIQILEAGRDLQQQGDLEEALRRYREALVQNEEYPPTHVALASLYLQLEREDDALRELERAAELAPDSAFVWRQLGQLYLKRDDYEAGVAALEMAREADPQDQETHHMLGAAYLYRSYSDAERAVQELEEAIRLDPEDAAAHYRLAMAYVRRDDPSDEGRAVGALEKAIEIDPSQSEAYYYLGRLYLNLGQTEAAIKAWRHYVTVSDDQETVRKVRQWLAAQEESQSSQGNSSS